MKPLEEGLPFNPKELVTRYPAANVNERRLLPPQVAVSTVAFSLAPPAQDARAGGRVRAGLEGADAGPRPSTSVTLWLPLVRRIREPFRGLWALPGGPLRWNESLLDTSRRTLGDTTGAHPEYLEQLYACGEPQRSASDQRVVTIVYWALLSDSDAGDTAATSPDRVRENVGWFSADELPPLAFDHAEIVRYALWRLRNKTEYSTVAYRFVGETFTLAQLRAVHEAIVGRSVDAANFRRQVLASGNLVETGETETGVSYRPAKLYRFVADAGGVLGSPRELG
ncbi:NUDIX domain-containing protein [Klugiella xanthotipulae]|uniref:NUDIX hydrolase n=1 Tax=Klugiella xanthotipulae TaxID=244735 RepID=UPI003387EF14